MNKKIGLLFMPLCITCCMLVRGHALIPVLSVELVQNPMPDGIWQAVITRKDGQEIHFNFETKDSSGGKILYIINGKERLLADQVQQRGDSVFIQMPFFDSRFALRISGKSRLEGVWIKNYGDRVVSLPFHASWNQPDRFEVSKQPQFDVSGRWSAHFEEDNSILDAVGEFRQSGYRVTGTFLTTTGDYRFLEGVVDGDSLKLSTFDGGHAYFFTAKIDGNKKLSGGLFYAGAVNKESWNAERDEQAALPDEYSLTRLKNPNQSVLDFKFRDMEGRMVSINDQRFKHKVVIVQIMGSWCPNCMDETPFLSNFYKEYRQRGVEMIALAYERTTNFELSKKSLLAFKTRFNVTYPILITGVTVSDTLRTEKTLPQLEKIIGFPTTIFIGKKGQVRKISTGFNGPGTGDHYEIFKADFKQQVDALLLE